MSFYDVEGHRLLTRRMARMPEEARAASAWEHELALICLATWFITQTKLEWREQYPRDPALTAELGNEM